MGENIKLSMFSKAEDQRTEAQRIHDSIMWRLAKVSAFADRVTTDIELEKDRKALIKD